MNARNERNQHKKETEDKHMAAILSINAAGQSGKKINKNIYGHFSEHLGRCIYGGVYVGENSDIPNVNGMRTDVVQALKKIGVPVLRWPGGCFADEYHWEDGIGPKETRKRMVNTNWGGVVEDNSFGTHEFMELCRQIGCEPLRQRERRLRHGARNGGMGGVHEFHGRFHRCAEALGERAQGAVQPQIPRRGQ